ncbi:response regulator [Acuticoccus mangrovi]|uniref:Response regulator n=1 Tax=Acuticoccus mangrovi TaxID=2796142 RepID=A0A934IP18_9HYPH|nr:response regulator [Acuticoccus mangrovi]MBJ3778441.1 response regulator [Acuticoccus mangrovi]
MPIFVCDDNALIAMMLEDLIETLGHRCCGVASAFSPALEGAVENGATLALVDLDLADGATGLTLVGALAEHDIPSIIISGQAHSVPPGHGAVALFEKPVDEVALSAAIQRVVG